MCVEVVVSGENGGECPHTHECWRKSSTRAWSGHRGRTVTFHVYRGARATFVLYELWRMNGNTTLEAQGDDSNSAGLLAAARGAAGHEDGLGDDGGALVLGRRVLLADRLGGGGIGGAHAGLPATYPNL